MHELNGTQLPEWPYKDLEWFGDILEIDGPTLSEFRNSLNQSFMYFWCDCDESFNRWMVFRINENDRIRLLVGDLSLAQIVKTACSEFVFFVDISEKSKKYWYVDGSLVDNSYFPKDSSFISLSEDSDLLDRSNISILFNENWNIESLRTFFRSYRHLHNFYYATSNKIVRTIPNMPWQGGFSAMHFYNNLDKKIQGINAPQEKYLRAASPGILKVSVGEEYAKKVLLALSNYDMNKESIDETYRSIRRTIKDTRLNKISIELATQRFEQNKKLVSLREELAQLLELESNLSDISVGRSLFESAKILMAHYVRVRSVYEEAESGRILIARWRLLKNKIDANRS